MVMNVTRMLLMAALLISTNAIQRAKGDIITVLTDGQIIFTPPFSMSHHEDPSDGLPIASVTYNTKDSQSTNGSGRVSFIGTTALWMVRDPASITNRVTTIRELKELIDTKVDKGSATNMTETIIKFQKQDALEISGYFRGSWHDQIIMYWGKPQTWNNNPIFVIDSETTKKEMCKTLITSVSVTPPKSD